MPKGDKIERSPSARVAANVTVVGALIAMAAGMVAGAYRDPSASTCPVLSAHFEWVRKPTLVVEFCAVVPNFVSGVAFRFDLQFRFAVIAPIDAMGGDDR